jgi:hypothetical protein
MPTVELEVIPYGPAGHKKAVLTARAALHMVPDEEEPHQPS